MKNSILILLVICCFSITKAQVVTPEIESRADDLVSQMTLDEKLAYISGYNSFYIRAIPRLGIPEIRMADGPQGIRNNTKSTMFPAGILTASTWNRELINQLGVSLGQDARARGVHILLGPGVNIYRAPMCGRNFEYFGEDPYLTSEVAKQYILGVQSQKVMATIKHFVANNQEWDRLNVSSDIDDRTLHEIYLPAFEKAVKEANVGAVMTSYNLLNGVHTSENRDINIDILRKQWGYKGIVMSDWRSVYSAVGAANGGLDIEMPQGVYFNATYLKPAIERGLVTEKTIDAKVKHILQTIIAFGFMNESQQDSSILLDNPKSKEVALSLAREGVVLLKNEGNILPLKNEKITVLGINADVIPTGGGSGFVTPYSTISTYEGLNTLLPKKVSMISDSLVYRNISPDFVDQVYKVEYFDNKELKGNPILVNTEKDINFNWDENNPLKMSNVKNYSIRWSTTYKPMRSGIVRVKLDGKDGYALFVNNKRIISAWHSGQKARLGCFEAEAGKEYEIKIEFYRDNAEKGMLKLEAGILDDDLLNSYLQKSANTLVMCIGYDGDSEFEASDRTFALPLWQQVFIDKVTKSGKKIIAVVNAGGGIDFSTWENKVQAILLAWYPGQEGGQAIAEILSGKISPSGKLPISIERKWTDNPVSNSYYESKNVNQTRPIVHKRVQYDEGVFLGYRGYDLSGISPMYPFGYGLSYTTFKYSNLDVNVVGDHVIVSFSVANTGRQAAYETAQVYVRDIDSSVPRPDKELKGFDKIFLKSGESKVVTIKLDKRAFSFYDVDSKAFKLEEGVFVVEVGASSVDLPLNAKIELRNL